MSEHGEPDLLRSTYTYLCIGCPLGCRLEVEEGTEGEVVEVRGFSCRKGERFAEQEHVDPRRMVTTTVAIDGARWARLPVKTQGEVPKSIVRDVCREIHATRVRAPVALGDVVVRDVLGCGVDVVATRSMAGVDP